MNEFREFLRGDNFFAKAVTFGMIPLFWRICLGIGRWCGYGEDLLMFGVSGIWIGVVIGYQLDRWIFSDLIATTSKKTDD